MHDALRLSQVCRGFGRGEARVEVLRGIDLTVPAGKMIALVGPSGSGKSTLLQIAGLLALPEFGTVSVAGQDVSTASDEERTLMRRHHVGFVYQFHHLLPELTALENVMMPLLIAQISVKEAQPRAFALLEKVGLSHRITHRPSEMSGGECQRVAIARALIARPALVLADEPTGNLDPHTAENVFAMLRECLQQSGAGALIATHNLELAARMDGIVRLHDGRVSH
jgi:lipoprotein-releasing system ATP-binding protein